MSAKKKSPKDPPLDPVRKEIRRLEGCIRRYETELASIERRFHDEAKSVLKALERAGALRDALREGIGLPIERMTQ